MTNLIPNLISLITGGVIWEAIKFSYPEVKRKIDSYLQAIKELNENLDPILKSCDDLYGKIQSLAKEDFSTFVNESKSISNDPDLNRQYIYYLFGQFWAHLEYIRIKSKYSSIIRTKRGKQLIRFIESYESRQFRLLDRPIQRMIGEALIERSSSVFRIMSLHQFYDALHSKNSSSNIWIKKLEDQLLATSDKMIRQKVLVFGIIVAALMDHFDPNHSISRRRPIYINKLSEKSKDDIKNTLLGHYLPFVKNPEIYYTKK
ncbi:MAG: hypothetical protein M3040_04125 [Bacteroidota bacterium]|nr:hypothetical protein [Bacteroidota bacterium]